MSAFDNQHDVRLCVLDTNIYAGCSVQMFHVFIQLQLQLQFFTGKIHLRAIMYNSKECIARIVVCQRIKSF